MKRTCFGTGGLLVGSNLEFQILEGGCRLYQLPVRPESAPAKINWRPNTAEERAQLGEMIDEVMGCDASSRRCRRRTRIGLMPRSISDRRGRTGVPGQLPCSVRNVSGRVATDARRKTIRFQDV